MIAVHETPAGVTFAVKVQPRARRNAILGEIGETLRIALTAPPVDGKANRACVEFLAELLRLPRSSVAIVSGQTSRNKVIRVTGISGAELQKLLQAEK